ncbi:MAG: tetratricopeptide repeat protein [Myxococcota bacterium]
MRPLPAPLRLVYRVGVTLVVGLGWAGLYALRNLFLAMSEAAYHRNVGDLLASVGWLLGAGRAYARADEAAGDVEGGAGPADFESCCLAGRCAQITGDLGLAVRFYRRALKREPGNHALHRMLGEALLDQRRFGTALQHLERALWRAGSDPELRMKAAHAATVMGEGERAREHLRRVVDEHRETRVGFLAQARLALGRGDGSVALRAALRAAAFSPRDVEARLLLAEACARCGHLSDAERHYRDILRQHPDQIDARVGLTDLLLARDPAAALALVEEGLYAEPRDAALLCAKGEALLKLGQVKAARRCLQASAHSEPDRARVHEKLAEVQRLEQGGGEGGVTRG